jgi:hypothetical protein
VSAAALFNSRGALETLSSWRVPTIFVAATNDTTVPASDVQTAFGLLVDRGVPTQFLVNKPSPVYPERFWPIEGLSANDSVIIQESIALGGFLDSQGYLLEDPATSNWDVLVPVEYLSGRPALEEQLTVAFAGHGFSSNFAQRVLDFFAAPVTIIDNEPVITGFDPAHGPPGTEVTIIGQNLIGVNSVSFGGALASFTMVSSREIRALVPVDAQSAPLTVSNAVASVSSPETFFVDGPYVLSFTPEEGGVDTAVTITGGNLVNIEEVTIGGRPALHSATDATTLLARVPVGATTGVITVRNPQGTAVTSTEMILHPAPVITSVEPTSVRVGSKVTLTGANLGPVYALAFGTVLATFTVESDTVITTVVPADAPCRCKIRVQSPGGIAASTTIRVK